MTHHNPFRLNVGFFLNLPVGESRIFPFESPKYEFSPDVNLTGITGEIRIMRTAQGLLTQTAASAAVAAECVRCLIPFDLQLQTDFTELYAFSQSQTEENGIVLPEDSHIDLAPLLREYYLLEIPINPVCKPDCKGLCPRCGNNLNDQVCDHSDDEIDPRLAGLRSLLDEH